MATSVSAPQNLEAHPVEQNGYVGFAATWSPVVNPDPEVTDYGYSIDIQPDVRNIFARNFPIVVTEPHGGIVPLPAGTYTVSVRSLNAFVDGAAATTTVTIPPRTMPPGYVSLVPARLLDTRPDGSTVDGAMVAIGKRAAGTITEVQVAGRGAPLQGRRPQRST